MAIESEKRGVSSGGRGGWPQRHLWGAAINWLARWFKRINSALAFKPPNRNKIHLKLNGI